MTEKVVSKILELSSSNDIYITLNVLLMSSRPNLNNALFNKDFIVDIVENKGDYIGLPLVCEKDKLEKGKFKNLGHKLNYDGSFDTEQVGSYIDFSYKEADDGEYELFGTVRVFKRFPKVCDAIIQLFEDESLFFSVEVYVAEYTKRGDGIREVGKNDGNRFVGDCIVSYPADVNSKAQMLIAEALYKDLEGDNMNKEAKFFEKTIMHFENCELDIHQVQKKVLSKCYENCKESIYDMYCTDFGVDFMILQEYNSGEYYRADYSVANDSVTVSDLYKVSKKYVPVNDNSDDEIAMKNKEVCENMELQEKLDQALASIETLQNSISEKDTVIASKEALISEKETAITELSEKVNTLSETVVVKDNEIAELTQCKAELDKINLEKAEVEAEQKRVDLKAKYSKLLSEEVLNSTEIAEAIKSLDESVLQVKVVESALEKAEQTKQNKNDKGVVIASKRISDDISVGGSDILSKYVTVNK